MVIEPGNGLNTHTATSSKARQAAAPVREKSAQATENTASSDSDSVSLSDAGQSLAKLEARLSEMPAVDSAKVAEVRAALANGRFQVDAEAIAGKMLDQDQSF